MRTCGSALDRDPSWRLPSIALSRSSAAKAQHQPRHAGHLRHRTAGPSQAQLPRETRCACFHIRAGFLISVKSANRAVTHACPRPAVVGSVRPVSTQKVNTEAKKGQLSLLSAGNYLYLQNPKHIHTSTHSHTACKHTESHSLDRIVIALTHGQKLQQLRKGRACAHTRALREVAVRADCGRM